jgi:16S rRNA (guanine527-N7)-methyltransferase
MTANGANELLSKYVGEIELFNEAYGLVKVASSEELWTRHILDSLAPLDLMPDFSEAADIGSGAGLPGLPLAIASGKSWTLVERMGRRAAFLRNTVAVLGLQNVEVLEEQAEKLAPESFDLVTCRAFSPINAALLKTLRRPLKKGGAIVLYKGRRDTINAELAAIPEAALAGLSIEIKPYTVPSLNEERNLVILTP